MNASPTGARPQNGGAGQGQGNNEGFNNESFQLDDGDQHLESAGGRRTSRTTVCISTATAQELHNEDNKACISISEGDTDKKRTKHIAKHFHFVKEKRAAGLVVLKYLATALQVADMFTKQIFPKHFERLRRVMMGHENFDDMCERYQDAKAAGDDVDDPKLYTVKPVRPPNG